MATSGQTSRHVPSARAVVTVDGRVAWTGTRSAAFGASQAAGYVTLHAVPGGPRTTVSVVYPG